MFWRQKGIKRRILEYLRETIKEKTIIYTRFFSKNSHSFELSSFFIRFFLFMNMSKILSIQVYSDFACPWCFVGKRRMEAVFL